MNLKEAYRYSNFLTSMMDKANSMLYLNEFVTKTEQTHLRTKTNPEAEDETIVVVSPRFAGIDYTPDKVIALYSKLLEERKQLFAAIAEAKADEDFNIDNAISMNKCRQNFVTRLEGLLSLKPNERQTTGTGYKFDINNEQKPYTYEIKERTELAFNKEAVKELVKSLKEECDKVSSELDMVEVTSQVDFEPKFSITDTFEDLVVA